MQTVLNSVIQEKVNIDILTLAISKGRSILVSSMDFKYLPIIRSFGFLARKNCNRVEVFGSLSMFERLLKRFPRCKLEMGEHVIQFQEMEKERLKY